LAIDMFGSNPAFPAKESEAFRKRAEGKEGETFAKSEVSGNDVHDRCQVWLERVADFIGAEITGDRMNVADIYLKRDCLDANPAQVALRNQVNQGRLVCDVLEVVG